ncbi:MAG TPA: hypothetical protein VNZ26_35520, partial [Vicinamibacterales bacterium]|nr:hypothetical protein [Vicinamibacterales bacterium]
MRISTRVRVGLAAAAAVSALLGAYPFVTHGLRALYFRDADRRDEPVIRIDRGFSPQAPAALGDPLPLAFAVEWAGALVVDRAD